MYRSAHLKENAIEQHDKAMAAMQARIDLLEVNDALSSQFSRQQPEQPSRPNLMMVTANQGMYGADLMPLHVQQHANMQVRG